MEFIDPKKVRPGKLKHEGLDPEWRESLVTPTKSSAIWSNPPTNNGNLTFLRDESPEQEMFLWLVISDAFEVAVVRRPDLDEKTILGDLILISAGGQSRHGLDKIYLAAGRKYQAGQG